LGIIAGEKRSLSLERRELRFEKGRGEIFQNDQGRGGKRIRLGSKSNLRGGCRRNVRSDMKKCPRKTGGGKGTSWEEVTWIST